MLDYKVLRVFLSLLLCISMLMSAACFGEQDEAPPPEQTTSTTNTPAPSPDPEPAPADLQIISNDQSDYRIVISIVPTDFEINGAKQLQRMIKLLTGVTLPIVDDMDEAQDGENGKEIVVGGKTARNKFYDAPQDYADGYAVFVSNNRVVFEAGSQTGMDKAIYRFAEDCLGIDMDTDELYTAEDRNDIAVRLQYSAFSFFWDLLDWLDDYRIVYDGSYMQMRMAWYMHDAMETAVSKVDLTVSTEKPSGFRAAYIELCNTDTVKDGKFRIEKTEDNVLKISAGDYYGFVGAGRFFIDAMEKHGYIPLDDDEVTDGNFVHYLKDYEQASAYAYNNSSEYRVMFYNVLWDDPEADQRNLLNAELVGEYMPDVLGLQEVNKSRRGNQTDGKGGLIAMLADMNYAEAVDPRVKNLYGTNEYIPDTDSGATTGVIMLENTKNYYDDFNQTYAERVSGQAIRGYGTGGGTLVTVNGESFYTFYNCAPLLYNTQTTKCIDAGYYWYKNQWDKRTCSDCELCRNGTHSYDNSHHPNGATDAASKAATWGVFESLETGERYIAISTHMCTRSNYVKYLQAKELEALINELTNTYNYPVILGGDYNGTYTQPNYLHFTETAGYIDVERDNLAGLFTSKIKGHHPYPVNNEQRGYISENKSQTSVIFAPESSVDHIVLANGGKEKLDITVYGNIVDEMSLAGSDHFPICMDFSIR